MSLNEMNLSPYQVAQLYPVSLVGQPQSPAAAPAEAAPDWKFLGNNQKAVLVGVSYPDVMNLPDGQLEFLMQLLKACGLSLNDVALININNYKNITHTDILNHFNTSIVLLFGISAQDFGFPFETPPYQVQSFTSYTITHAPALQDLQNDKPAKGLLWAALKNIFNL